MREHTRCIRAHDVASLTGISVRTVQMMAARGVLQTALQRCVGGRWTFEEAAVRRWIKEREDAVQAGGQRILQAMHPARPVASEPYRSEREINAAYEHFMYPRGRAHREKYAARSRKAVATRKAKRSARQ